MAEEEAAALVIDDGSGLNRAGFLGDAQVAGNPSADEGGSSDDSNESNEDEASSPIDNMMYRVGSNGVNNDEFVMRIEHDNNGQYGNYFGKYTNNVNIVLIIVVVLVLIINAGICCISKRKMRKKLELKDDDSDDSDTTDSNDDDDVI